MLIVKAKYLIPDATHCIENGAVAVNGTKIYRTGTFDEVKELKDNSTIIDLENAVILPGLINIHTHLDLSNLQGQIPPTNNFTQWIFQLMGAKLKWKSEDYRNSVERGAKLCTEGGTTTVADVSSTGHSFTVLAKSPLRKTIYREVIGLNPVYAQKIIKKTREELSRISTNELLHTGISPHAPYSVSQELYQAAKQLANEKNIPMCTHIAETQEEIRFLTEGKGDLPVLLQKLRAMPGEWYPPKRTPIKYLYEMGILSNKMLLVHCNYISQEEISLIKSSGASIAFCPKSYRYFGHQNHSLQKLLDEGINVGLGTDSLASNDTLNILEEMKCLYANYTISPNTILAMATTNGSKALNSENTVGQIREGFEADLCGVKLPDHSFGHTIYDQLFGDSSRNIFTMIAGVVCHNSR